VYISENYKKLFGMTDPNNFSLFEETNLDIPQLSAEEILF
jgi:hypothetical protein